MWERTKRIKSEDTRSAAASSSAAAAASARVPPPTTLVVNYIPPTLRCPELEPPGMLCTDFEGRSRNQHYFVYDTVLDLVAYYHHIACLCADYTMSIYGLSDEQRRILVEAWKGEPMFLTGPAGTGKSRLLCEMIEVIQHKYKWNKDAVAATASSGIAGINIKGGTIHSWAGCGLFTDTAEEIGDIILNKWRRVRNRICRAVTLVWDEVSMSSADNITCVSEVCSIVRGDDRPFGGLQVIFCGDFLQLPPVKSPDFAFKSPEWNRLFTDTRFYHHLRFVQRQDDARLVRVLHRIRLGEFDSEMMEIVRPCINRVLKPINRIIPTRLYARRDDVSFENDSQLEQLPGEASEFNATDWCDPDDLGLMKKLEDVQAPRVLRLKIDAQVMLLCNDMHPELKNGSRGVVVGFSQAESIDDGKSMVVDLPKWNRAPDKNTLYPVVLFMNGETLVCSPHIWEIKQGKVTVATREQVPLMLAWAITIHKSQGQSLDFVEVALDGVRQGGQAYVAWSRGRTLEGTSIQLPRSRADDLTVCRSLIRANPEALAWHRRVFGAKYGYGDAKDVPAASASSSASAAAAAPFIPYRCTLPGCTIKIKGPFRSPGHSLVKPKCIPADHKLCLKHWTALATSDGKGLVAKPHACDK